MGVNIVSDLRTAVNTFLLWERLPANFVEHPGLVELSTRSTVECWLRNAINFWMIVLTDFQLCPKFCDVNLYHQAQCLASWILWETLQKMLLKWKNLWSSGRTCCLSMTRKNAWHDKRNRARQLRFSWLLGRTILLWIMLSKKSNHWTWKIRQTSSWNRWTVLSGTFCWMKTGKRSRPWPPTNSPWSDA